MLQIFHAPGARSLRVIWLAEEMGLDYALIGEAFGRPSPAFVEANPTRALPAIIDGEVVMSESVAIMQYLTARHGPTPLAPPAEDPTFPAYLQYLIFGEGSLSAFLNPLVGTRVFAPPDQQDNVTAGICRTIFKRRLAALGQRLTQSVHLAGEAFTAADISVGYALVMATNLDLAGDFPAPVADYWARLQLRPAYQRAAAK